MPDEHLRALMQELFDAHRAFRGEWDKWWGAGGKRNVEPEIVKSSRDRFLRALNRVFDERLEPVWVSFATDPVHATNNVIDFLEIDIPAHRCGYVKEKYLRKLKSTELSETQKERLKQAALALVSRGKFRREFRDWSRLMIVLADETFVRELRGAIRPLDAAAARYGERMLKTVLENRPDLRTDIDPTS